MNNDNIRIGVSPLSWMNSDMPELGSDIPLEQCLEEASTIGYEGVELEDPFRKIIDTFPSLLKKYNLSLIAGWHSTFLLDNGLKKEMEPLKKHMDLLASLGSNIVNLAECSRAVHRTTKGLSKRPQLSDSEWRSLCEQLDALADFLHRQGFVSAYHHHMGTVVQSGSDIDKLMEGTESLGLLFDTGHLCFAGEDPLDLLHRHVERVTHVHFKNVRSSILKEKIDNDAHFFSAIVDGAFTVPGDTSDLLPELSIDFKEAVNALQNNGYSGWIVIEAEQDPTKAHPATYAKLGYDTVTDLLFCPR